MCSDVTGFKHRTLVFYDLSLRLTNGKQKKKTEYTAL